TLRARTPVPPACFRCCSDSVRRRLENPLVLSAAGCAPPRFAPTSAASVNVLPSAGRLVVPGRNTRGRIPAPSARAKPCCHLSDKIDQRRPSSISPLAFMRFIFTSCRAYSSSLIPENRAASRCSAVNRTGPPVGRPVLIEGTSLVGGAL